MKDIIKFNETCNFPNNIADITSISMECNYQCEENNISGDFQIEGTYRIHELSINQENFSYSIPFTYEFNKKIDDESATVSINDFTYDIDDKELKVEIEYEVSAKEIIEPEIEDTTIEDLTSIREEPPKEIEENITEEHKEDNREEITNEIIDNIPLEEDKYITYHVYICNENDSLETISSQFKISQDTIRNYNEVDSISSGTKLIIPSIDE